MKYPKPPKDTAYTASELLEMPAGRRERIIKKQMAYAKLFHEDTMDGFDLYDEDVPCDISEFTNQSKEKSGSQTANRKSVVRLKKRALLWYFLTNARDIFQRR